MTHPVALGDCSACNIWHRDEDQDSRSGVSDAFRCRVHSSFSHVSVWPCPVRSDLSAQTLQQPKLCSTEGHGVVILTVKTFEGLRTKDNLDLFWERLEKTKDQLDVDKPWASDETKDAQAIWTRQHSGWVFSDLEGWILPGVFRGFDLAVTNISSTFDQKGFKTFSTMEQLLFKACRGQCLKEELEQVCTVFYDDSNKEGLLAELSTFHELYQSTVGDVVPSVDSIKTALLTLSATQQLLLKTVCRLFQFLLILPAMNATSEQSFTDLHSMKCQEHDVTSKGKSSDDLTLPPGCVWQT